MKFVSPVCAPNEPHTLVPSRSDLMKARRRMRVDFMNVLFHEIYLS